MKTHQKHRDEQAKLRGQIYVTGGDTTMVGDIPKINIFHDGFRDGWNKALEYAAKHMEQYIDGSDIHDPRLNRFLTLAAKELREMK